MTFNPRLKYCLAVKHTRTSSPGLAGRIIVQSKTIFETLQVVTANVLHSGLEVFEVDGRVGSGLRCRQAVKRGAFICQYSGEYISTTEAKRRLEDIYIAGTAE